MNVRPIGVGVIFPLVALLGVFYSLAFLLRTGCIDPGIVPRAKPDEIEYMQALGDTGRFPHILNYRLSISTRNIKYSWMLVFLIGHITLM